MTGIADTLLRRQVMLQRLSAGEINKFEPVLTEIDKAIRVQLSGDELTDFNRKRLESQLKAVDDLIDGTLTDYSKNLLDDLQKIAANEASFSATALNTVVDITTAIPAAVTVKAAVLSSPLAARGPNSGALLEAFIENWTTAQRNAVVGAIRMGVFQGKPNAEIVRAIRGTAARKYADGLLDVTARQAAAVVHTAIQHVSSVARQTVFDQNADIIAKVQWLSTLDRRTCFVAGTPVETPSGQVAIEKLTTGSKVIGGSRKPRTVLGTVRRSANNLVKIKLSNGKSIVCTADHLWLTRRGWIAASAMNIGEKLAKSL